MLYFKLASKMISMALPRLKILGIKIQRGRRTQTRSIVIRMARRPVGFVQVRVGGNPKSLGYLMATLRLSRCRQWI